MTTLKSYQKKLKKISLKFIEKLKNKIGERIMGTNRTSLTELTALLDKLKKIVNVDWVIIRDKQFLKSYQICYLDHSDILKPVPMYPPLDAYGGCSALEARAYIEGAIAIMEHNNI
jgi:hypothetical protein